MNTFEIIYEDDAILVCYKPAGIATQTRRLGQQDMESLLKNYRAKKKEQPYIGVVHRLDQPVEGVMVFAKTQKAAAELSKQVQQRSIGKKYYAVAHKLDKILGVGVSAINQEKKKVSGTKESCKQLKVSEKDEQLDFRYIKVTDFMTFDQRKNFGQIVTKGTKDAKKAELEYRICGEKDDLLMLDITLHTGRHHQIRLQMANAGYPLVGDQKYGAAVKNVQVDSGKSLSDNTPILKNDGIGKHEQLALCSYSLEFKHPVNRKDMKFEIKPKNEIFEIII